MMKYLPALVLLLGLAISAAAQDLQPPETTPEVTAEPSVPVLPTAEITPELTLEIAPEPSAQVTTIIPVPFATVAPSAQVLLNGFARYQNRRGTAAGIRVTAYNQYGIWLGDAETNPQGNFSIAVPADQSYWLEFDAPLHARQRLLMRPEVPFGGVILLGGDLTDDGCVGPDDLALLLANFGAIDSRTTDINGDGITDASDLALLAGNYDAACRPDIWTVAATPLPAMAEEIVPERTAEAEVAAEVTAPVVDEP